MTVALWSWLLAGLGITGHILTGRRKAAGWAVLMATEVLWLAYAVITDQPGFIVASFIFFGVYVSNYRKWAKTPGRKP